MEIVTDTQTPTALPDVESFRLRRLVQRFREEDELDVVGTQVDLIELGAHLDGNPKAVLFCAAGPEKAQVIGNAFGSRRRLALAFDVAEQDLRAEVSRRLQTPIPPVEVPSSAAPVHQVVWTGEQADFTKLPVHLQHSEDGAPYISASIDITRSLDGKKRNVGYRRIMLRGRQEAGIDLIAPSDLRALYAEYVQRKERMPIAFVVGSHPADGVAATAMSAVADEVDLMGALRGAPVPLVKCVSIDAMVPADAEVVLEGFLDERGWAESEGPYGEYLGYYGHMKTNPVFHLTAITMRRDALFQTITIGGKSLDCTDTAQLAALRTEAAAWSALTTAVREPIAVYATPSCGGMFNLRLSLHQRNPGEVRNAISAIMASSADVKHIFAVDSDIDIFSDAQMEWAFATRFQADRDLVVASGFRTMPLDPSLDGRRTGAKAGFDLTFPFGWNRETEFRVPEPPKLRSAPKQTVQEALKTGPKHFLELMEAVGSRDGRDVLIELDSVRQELGVTRAADGRYQLSN
ncbi:UbiD family decarboxylase [Pusillimonas noertemannii]|uniref:UbiD family decarboxylase n=1 Tax=Pusillimonas noertemannii TaxID=305977 RepID=A0A2U1CQV8_9BURK|nr:UbiD family decarboxylase [Pusillimonas noertemannii]NYT67601.1 UbiD family decarboxylase [Pusillimonas noertemannii]PVY68273.1 UbiD family decarboxylase [Pusillimonas noertemannii]TFL12233.1 UbiD family decarboxylase [Pusillimonas noertemannii]